MRCSRLRDDFVTDQARSVGFADNFTIDDENPLNFVDPDVNTKRSLL